MKRLHFLIVSIIFCILVFGCSSNRVPSKSGISLLSIEQISKSAETETDEMMKFLGKTVTFESVEKANDKLKQQTKDLMDFVFDTAKGIGFTTRRAAGGLVGVLEYGQGKEVVGVLIHLDVVGVEDEKDWQYPPFSGEITEDYVWGRGTQDNKGALAGVLWGAKILIDNGLVFKRKLRIILGTKEEIDFSSLKKYFEKEDQPDYGIVPDGIFIVPGEKGLVDIRFVFPGEASADELWTQRDKVVYWEGGESINIVPQFSYAVIKSKEVKETRAELNTLINQVKMKLKNEESRPLHGEMKPYEARLRWSDYGSFVKKYPGKKIPKEGHLVLYSEGKAAHGSTPWLGRNAIVEVALVGVLMSRLQDNMYKRAFYFVAGKIGSGIDVSQLGIPNYQYDDTKDQLPRLPGYTCQAIFGTSENPDINFMSQALLSTTANLGTVGLENNDLVLAVNFRIGLNIDGVDQVIRCSRAAVENFEGTVVYNEDDTYNPINHLRNPLLELVKTSYKEVIKEHEPLVLVSPGSTYMKLVNNFIGFGPVDFLTKGAKDKPIDTNLFHSRDEKFSIKQLKINMKLYAYTLQQLLQADRSPTSK